MLSPPGPSPSVDRCFPNSSPPSIETPFSGRLGRRGERFAGRSRRRDLSSFQQREGERYPTKEVVCPHVRSSCLIFMFDLRVRSSCSIFLFDPRPVSPGRPADPIGLRQTRESACIIITCARIITCSRKHHSSRSQNGKFVPEKSNIWRDCVDGYYDWVKEHIMEGAPLNEADHCGDPPLLLAAGNGHKAVCELLLDEGADVEQRNVMGESPLIRAAHNGHFHTVKFLVEQAKADVNAIDMGDNSALHWAAMRGHVEIVKFLTDQVRFLSRRRWLAAGGGGVSAGPRLLGVPEPLDVPPLASSGYALTRLGSKLAHTGCRQDAAQQAGQDGHRSVPAVLVRLVQVHEGSIGVSGMDWWTDGWMGGRMGGRMDGWTDGLVDGWIGGRIGGRMDGWTDGWVDGWMGGRMGGRMDGWTDGLVDGWIGGRMGGWTDGWTDGWVDGWVDGWMDGWADPTYGPVAAVGPLVRDTVPASGVQPLATTARQFQPRCKPNVVVLHQPIVTLVTVDLHAVIFCVSLPSLEPREPPFSAEPLGASNASLLLSWPLS